MLAVDISHWGGALRPETPRCWWERGVRRLIHGLQDLPLAEANIATVRRVEPRIGIEAYHYVYLTSATRDRRLAEAAAFCRRLGLPRLWIDLEDQSLAFERLAREERVRLVRDAVAKARALAGADVRLGIYTGLWWWELYLGRETQVAPDLPLWIALQDGRQDLRFPPFGGWRTAVMKQYAGTTSLCGHSVDLNWYEEEEMTPELKAILDALYGALLDVRRDLDETTKAVRGVFAFALDHVRSQHGGSVPPDLQASLEALAGRVGEIEARLRAAAESLGR